VSASRNNPGFVSDAVNKNVCMLTGRESWVLNELAYAGRENLDAGHVARYDHKEDADPAAEVAALIPFGLGPNAIVVDIGAGTGQFVLAAAATARRVVAVDVSPAMLEHLRTKLARDDVGNVACVQAGFLTYEHVGEPADLVYSRYALHHLPDFWKALALARIANMLRPGGVLRLSDIVYSLDPTDAAAGLERWMSRTASESITDGWTRTELEEHIRDEHSTFVWLLEPMIARAGFVIERADYSEDRVLAHYICVKTHQP
jgi:SAM-dependent methyltransferase